jgi:hypothetical protein
MGFSRDFFVGAFCRGRNRGQNLHVIKVKSGRKNDGRFGVVVGELDGIG